MGLALLCEKFEWECSVRAGVLFIAFPVVDFVWAQVHGLAEVLRARVYFVCVCLFYRLYYIVLHMSAYEVTP